MAEQSPSPPALDRSHWAVLVGVALVFLWAYATSLEELTQLWAQDAQYSHGFLVPVAAVALVWLRRREFAAVPMRPSVWGLVLLLLGTALRLGGAYLYYVWPDRISLLPVLVGVCVALGGWQALRWTWPGLVLLLFMLPLPSQLQGALAYPLQRVATYVLQTIGLPAQEEGNVILLSEGQLNVIEACNGLRMLVTFFALATAVVLFLRPACWQALIVLASAVPIALICNVARLVTTGILHETIGPEAARGFDATGGWLMMPLAAGLLYLELVLLGRLITVVPEVGDADLARLALGTKPPAAPPRRPAKPLQARASS
jgi:exosortase